VGSVKQDRLQEIMTVHKVGIYQRTWRSSGVPLIFCIGRSGVQDSGPETDYTNGIFIIFSSVSRINAEVVPLNCQNPPRVVAPIEEEEEEPVN
jgi:hypothetical protein